MSHNREIIQRFLKGFGKFVLFAIFLIIMIISLFNSIYAILSIMGNFSFVFVISQFSWLCINLAIFILSFFVQIRIAKGIWVFSPKPTAIQENQPKKQAPVIKVIKLLLLIGIFIIFGFFEMQYLQESILRIGIYLIIFMVLAIWLTLGIYKSMYDMDSVVYNRLITNLILSSSLLLIFIVIAEINSIFAIQISLFFIIAFLILQYYFSKELYKQTVK